MEFLLNIKYRVTSPCVRTRENRGEYFFFFLEDLTPGEAREIEKLGREYLRYGEAKRNAKIS